MIRRATDQDLPGINRLTHRYRLEPVRSEFINNRDICLVADVGGQIRGYIWAGLMARNTFAYVCGFAVDPEFTGSGIGTQLSRELLRVARMKGVKSFVATVENGPFHDACAVNALKCGAGAADKEHTLLVGDLAHMTESIKELEDDERRLGA